MTGNALEVGAMMCNSEKAIINAAKKVYLTLYNLDNNLFIDHFMKYFQKKHIC